MNNLTPGMYSFESVYGLASPTYYRKWDGETWYWGDTNLEVAKRSICPLVLTNSQKMTGWVCDLPESIYAPLIPQQLDLFS